jgi:hypothetical protein
LHRELVAVDRSVEPIHRPDLADIFRACLEQLGPLGEQQRKAVSAILRCRTPAAGARLCECDSCGHRKRIFNSCRNRHCPKCQWPEQQRWLEAREAEVLPVPYFHQVLTVPHELSRFFFAQPRLLYGLLFSAASSTLLEVAANPKNLGAHIGLTAVLHTWTQTLQFHPHLHCVVPGGGLDPKSGEWVSCGSSYFLPNKVVGIVFRGKLLSAIEGLLQQGQLGVPLQEGRSLLRAAAEHDWVVYCKEPFAGPRHVLRYLSLYTHRIAISNSRIISFDGRSVTFRYRDREAEQTRTMELDAVAFAKRFLQHVVPRGFMRLRHYGFLANAVKARSLPIARAALKARGLVVALPPKSSSSEEKLTPRCPACKSGRMLILFYLDPTQAADERWETYGRSTEP